MTCYETLPAVAPADDVFDTSMAQHFVKWWRNKFRNGYKKFSHFADSERTDTEELIGRVSPQCSAPPDILPSEARALLQPNPSPAKLIAKDTSDNQSPLITYSNENEKPPRLKFEELTCDVELQHPQPSKQKPLQFSFTLYDLDGHGRMTKDDIAGIVSTIYESIGKSVTVPHYGSKTIQVKLTVIPENDRQDRPEGRRRRRREKHIPHEYVENSEEEHQERISPDDDVSSKSSGSVERRKERLPPPPQQSRHKHHSKEQRYRKRQKKRSGSLQRRELLEIIQANMEKNHLNFQTSRKTSETANDEELPVKAHKTRNRSFTLSEKPAASTFHNNKIDNGYGYLDLASGQGQGHGDSNLCRYDRYLHAVICSSAKHAHSGYHQKQTQKSRPATTAKTRLQEMIHPNPSNPRVLQIIFL